MEMCKMINFKDYVDEKVVEKRILNESAEMDLTKDVFKKYMQLFESLSDAFSEMNRKENVDGNGNVSDALTKVKLAVDDIKKTLKPMKNSEDKVKFDSSTKKSLGEISNSLVSMKGKIQREIMPSLVSIEKPEIDLSIDDEDELA